VCIVLVGHVTKEGALPARVRWSNNMVDTVGIVSL
jgi:predicted ATP-dependent serine protease